MTLAEQATGNSAALQEIQRLRMLGVLSGGWIAQACYVLAALRLPDRLAAGPATAAELAAASDVDRTALGRLLAALAGAGVLTEPAPGTYGLTPAAQFLRSDVPGSVHANAVLYGEEVYRCFGELLPAVRAGRPAFPDCYGMPFYDYLAEHPDTADTFNAAMGQRVPPALSAAVLSGVDRVVDVGGGNASLLARVLTEHPRLRGTLLELPEAARQARGLLAAAGVLDRVDVVEGSFFDEVPGGADLYVLSRVLHNWDDANALRLLGTVRRAMPPAARLVVLEGLLPEAGADRPAGRRLDANRTRMVDLLMLVVLEGHDRTAAECHALLSTAGFRVLATTAPTAEGAEGRIEAVPA